MGVRYFIARLHESFIYILFLLFVPKDTGAVGFLMGEHLIDIMQIWIYCKI